VYEIDPLTNRATLAFSMDGYFAGLFSRHFALEWSVRRARRAGPALGPRSKYTLKYTGLKAEYTGLKA